MDRLLDRDGRKARIINVASDSQVVFKRKYTPFLEAGDLWNTHIDPTKTGPLKYNTMASYGLSKFCNVAFARGLGKLIEAKGWTSLRTASLHPGVIFTDIWRPMDDIAIIKKYFKPILVALMKFFMRTEEEGAATIST